MDNRFEVVLSAAKKVSTELGDLVELGLEYVPFLGKALSFMKIRRLETRINEHQQQLSRISKLNASTSMAADYVQQRIFPIVLESLIEEHEDAKINLILNGFENVFIEEKSNESVVINFFDTLRELRYMDIKRFLYLADVLDEFLFESQGSEESSVTRNIDKKLQNLGLVGFRSTGYFSGGEQSLAKDNVRINPYGIAFLNFITINI